MQRIVYTLTVSGRPVLPFFLTRTGCSAWKVRTVSIILGDYTCTAEAGDFFDRF